MSALTIALLILIIALGTYFQTITSFGLAMIVIGISSGIELTSVPFIATVVSLISQDFVAVYLVCLVHLSYFICTDNPCQYQ